MSGRKNCGYWKVIWLLYFYGQTLRKLSDEKTV